MRHSYPIKLRHIYISPGHNYFGHSAEKLGTSPTFDLDNVEAKAGLGLVGDRFYGLKEGFDGQITFFAWEVFQQLQSEIAVTRISPEALRRNVIVEGVHLNALIGHDFEIRAGHEPSKREVHQKESSILFHGARHCNPCRWMDIGVGGGALKYLKGRGGLRAQIQSNGTLHRGMATLYTDVEFEPSEAAEPLTYPRLP